LYVIELNSLFSSSDGEVSAVRLTKEKLGAVRHRRAKLHSHSINRSTARFSTGSVFDIVKHSCEASHATIAANSSTSTNRLIGMFGPNIGEDKGAENTGFLDQGTDPTAESGPWS
jgi:hypothetical protein